MSPWSMRKNQCLWAVTHSLGMCAFAVIMVCGIGRRVIAWNAHGSGTIGSTRRIEWSAVLPNGDAGVLILGRYGGGRNTVSCVVLLLERRYSVLVVGSRHEDEGKGKAPAPAHPSGGGA